ncbi:hypothetical protein DAPPUDRAFT_331446 [Daphnia pulex]|uniref:Uncharacterized protein n=1 Tax=Daphnia pulex TaxID=6669 RepID=E9HMI6_DAPPU|nr:hypothetical protein DAPPUDRAFT_331446 [Daphnia pulex]|eukprot:EFX67026.1 hypothetical protein DAPPUDRAFT_331446 [Daphnia pulex]
MPGWKVGYMNNHPGDLNGKIAYYVILLKDPENAGIPPTDVIFMSYGANIISDTEYGVDPNFTIFNVQILHEKILEIRSHNSTGVPDCIEPTVQMQCTGTIRSDSGVSSYHQPHLGSIHSHLQHQQQQQHHPYYEPPYLVQGNVSNDVMMNDTVSQAWLSASGRSPHHHSNSLFNICFLHGLNFRNFNA